MTVEQPRVFMSYSWTTPEYAERVVALAEQLSADGVHVILDRWDLREGQDKHRFMEDAVTDPTVHRVLILCDPTYAAKANGRQGGVGTETLIISTEVYREAKQEKFVPVIMERDDAGQVVVPTYLNGRIYVDLSDPDHSEPEYEKLVRNVFGKPELTRPALGRPPAYIDQRETALVTGRSLAAFRDAVLRDRPHQAGLLDDYLSRLIGALRAEVIADAESLQDLDVRIIDALTRFLPYREEYFQLLDFVVRDEAANRFYDRIHRFFETLTNIRYQHEASRWGEGEVEVLTFISWELFLYTAAAAIRNENFGVISTLTKPIFVNSRQSAQGALRSFSAVAGSCRVMQEVTQKRLKETYYSYQTHLLKERSQHAILPFDALMEADLVLWFRAEIVPNVSWFPRTSFYWEYISGLPLFVRAQSQEFFKRLAVALGVDDKLGLEQALAGLPEQSFYKAGDFWGGRGSYVELFGLPRIASLP